MNGLMVLRMRRNKKQEPQVTDQRFLILFTELTWYESRSSISMFRYKLLITSSALISDPRFVPFADDYIFHSPKDHNQMLLVFVQ